MSFPTSSRSLCFPPARCNRQGKQPGQSGEKCGKQIKHGHPVAKPFLFFSFWPGVDQDQLCANRFQHTSANALLRVDGASELSEIRVGVDSSEEDGLVLIRAMEKGGFQDQLSSRCIVFLSVAWLCQATLQSNQRIRTWFMPALAKSKVGSSWGMVEELGTKVCPFWSRKYEMNVSRTLTAVQWSGRKVILTA